MKRIISIIILGMALSLTAQAQLGSLVSKALNKAAQEAGKAASTKIKERMGLSAESQTKATIPETTFNTSAEDTPEVTLEQLLASLPDMPTTQQLISHKEAMLKEQNLRMLTSPVTTYLTQVFTLGTQFSAMAFSQIDTNMMMYAAYAATGLTPEMVKAMENMSDEEQEAFMIDYMQSGKADEALTRRTEREAQFAQATEDLHNQYNAVEEKVEQLYTAFYKDIASLYDSYSKESENLEGTHATAVELNFYSKIADRQRNVVSQAMNLRLKEQFPVAKQIDEMNVSLSKKNGEGYMSMISYVSLFGQSYFAEISKLLETPSVYLDAE